MTNLLKLKVVSTTHAYLSAEGVRISAPWGSIDLEAIYIPTGWFKLVMDDVGAVCVQLTQKDGFKIVELSAVAECPAYVRFEKGHFQPKLFFGARPGFYPVTKLLFKPLPFLELVHFFTSRLISAIVAGVGPKRLLRMIALATFGQGTFGVKATQDCSGLSLGLLTKQDVKQETVQKPEYRNRIADLNWKPTFFVSYQDFPLDQFEEELILASQIYSYYHIDPNAEYDYHLVIGRDEQLTDDALLLFAEKAVNSPGFEVIIADVWTNGIPTMRSAFDPLLYRARHYPTPFLLQKNAQAETTTPWVQRQAQHGIISVPVATSSSQTRLQHFEDTETAMCTPFVSVIIPTRDKAELLENSLAGLFEHTDWPHEVIVVDNGSVQDQTFTVFEKYSQKGLRVVRSDTEFNFSRLCNIGAKYSKGEVIIFMNNDVQLMNSKWLGEMVKYATLPQIGAVGGRLHYTDMTLQHGGIALGLTEVCGHLYHGLPLEEQEAIPSLVHPSVRTAVTAALLGIEKQKFFDVGGFDEIDFPVTLNDVDLCLKLRSQGLFNAYVPMAQAFHHQGATRGKDISRVKVARRLVELTRFTQKWPLEILSDPWLPPALSNATESPKFR